MTRCCDSVILRFTLISLFRDNFLFLLDDTHARYMYISSQLTIQYQSNSWNYSLQFRLPCHFCFVFKLQITIRILIYNYCLILVLWVVKKCRPKLIYPEITEQLSGSNLQTQTFRRLGVDVEPVPLQRWWLNMLSVRQLLLLSTPWGTPDFSCRWRSFL